MFLYRFFADLCPQLNMPFYSIHNQPPNHRQLPPDIDRGFVLGPLRSFSTEGFDFPRLQRVGHLLQIRDPRDILVSEYFSLGWIHSDRDWTDADRDHRTRIRNMSVDDYVIKEDEISKYPLMQRYSPILQLHDQPDVTIVRYEDMVLDFERWLQPVLQTMELRPTARWQRQLASKYRDEFLPDSRPGAHKRNVLPGDHRSKLKPETIALLNRRFEPILSVLGYLPAVAAA
ncbi:MAG: hypothetical protein ACR2NP_06135 [Pirellulaceae bacterium]